MSRGKYRVCPLCHANLDFGEKCDCESEAAEREKLFIEGTRINPITGQMSFDWGGKDTKNEVETTNQHRGGHRSISRFSNGSQQQQQLAG